MPPRDRDHERIATLESQHDSMKDVIKAHGDALNQHAIAVATRFSTVDKAIKDLEVGQAKDSTKLALVLAIAVFLATAFSQVIVFWITKK
jgi:hypothetical protein